MKEGCFKRIKTPTINLKHQNQVLPNFLNTQFSTFGSNLKKQVLNLILKKKRSFELFCYDLDVRSLYGWQLE